MKTTDLVLEDLQELAPLLGLAEVRLRRAKEYVASHGPEIEEFRANGMKIQEITDHVLTVS